MAILDLLVRTIDLLLKRTLQLLLVMITTMVIWQVVSRYLLTSPSSFTEEAARFLLIWLTLLGAASAYRNHAHLGLDIIYAHSTGLQKHLMFYFIHSCVALFAISVMVIGGASLVAMTHEFKQLSPVMGIPISYIYTVIPFSGCLLVVYAVYIMLTKNETFSSAAAPPNSHNTTQPNEPGNNSL